ncbi:MAG: hypothetical protein ACK5JM_11600 [Rhodoblastus sp.]
MGAQTLTPYEVKAFNTAIASENKIHSDEVAQSFGFVGALVPGVEVYAYMTHIPVERWGRNWLERGGAASRFLKPVYDGKTARITARGYNGALNLNVESESVVCAEGQAFMAEAATAPAFDSLPLGTLPDVRPKADENNLAPGRSLGLAPVTIDRGALQQYLADIRETEGLYLHENLVHPGQILRLCNAALVQSVELGPWIHVGSSVRNFSVARVGQELTLRNRIVSNTVSKGHAIVVFDALAIANGNQVVAQITHTAIWRPRGVAPAA